MPLLGKSMTQFETFHSWVIYKPKCSTDANIMTKATKDMIPNMKDSNAHPLATPEALYAASSSPLRYSLGTCKWNQQIKVIY